MKPEKEVRGDGTYRNYAFKFGFIGTCAFVDSIHSGIELSLRLLPITKFTSERSQLKLNTSLLINY